MFWYTGDAFKATIERTGARHVGFTAGFDVDETDLDASFPGRAAVKPGIRQLKFDLQALFIDTIPGHMADLRELVDRDPFDALVVESTFIAGGFLAEERNLPWVAYGVTP